MKKNYKYILMFIYFFVVLKYIYIPFRMDTYNNYGFSYAIVNGEIPYKDFYLIVPLFGPFLYSILLIFNKSIIVFYLEQTILLILFSKLLFKIFDNKAWIIITCLFCPFVFCFAYSLFPGYNFLILFELVLLLYLTKENKSDKVIGLVAGISLLTKQNIGLFILLVTVLYPLFKNKKSSLTRFCFSMIPCMIFITYLLCTNTLYDFINLCVLGIKDFNNNLVIKPIYLVFLIISVIAILIKFIMSKDKNISYYYLMSYLFVVYPLIDSYHVSLFILFLIIVYLYNTPFKIKKRGVVISNIIIVLFGISWYIASYNYFSKLNYYSYPNFYNEIMSYNDKKDYDYIIKFYKKHNNTIYICSPSKTMILSGITSSKIDHYFVLFRGNLGYNGEKNIIKKLDNTHDKYFVVQNTIECSTDDCQFIEKVPMKIKSSYKKIKELNNFSIYYKE